jgi:diketogulonate reductase-like aldo/keto reductase
MVVRMRVEKVDVYLLHNPEYFFTDASKRCFARDAERPVLLPRIQRAFSHLEDEVRRGRIGFYGVSSNTFGALASDLEAIVMAVSGDADRTVTASRSIRSTWTPR